VRVDDPHRRFFWVLEGFNWMIVPPTVVFDLDGTLVDTAPDLVATLNVVLAGEGLPPVVYEEARNMVGSGARVMIERGLAAQARVLPAAEIGRMVRGFIDHYAAHIADNSCPFAGVEAALDALAVGGCRLAVCTNKLEWLSLRLLDTLGLTGRFAAICGSDTFGVGKPNPDILRGTIDRVGGRAELAVMVGDSATDIATARAAAVAVIAVDFGYTDIPVAELGPDRVVGRFADLPEAVFALLDAQKGQLSEFG
jgi:phosphoglycolate phosphatase